MSHSSSNSFYSSSSKGLRFRFFLLGEEGFNSVSIPTLPSINGEHRVSASLFRNSLAPNRLHALAEQYYVLFDQEMLVPRSRDTVLHHPEGFCAIYVDHFKAGLRLPLFPFLVDILLHYELALSQLVPNAICTVISF